jgi:hypothetical protein
MPAAHVPPALLFAVALLSPTPSFAQLNVITSVGFEAAYNELVPVFQKNSGISVSTKHFASQGNGPDTIAAQLRAGAAADVLILSKEGLGELLAESRIHPSKRGGPGAGSTGCEGMGQSASRPCLISCCLRNSVVHPRRCLSLAAGLAEGIF